MKLQIGKDMDKATEGKTKILTPASDDGSLVSITTKDSLTGNDGLLQENLPVAIEKTEQTCNVFRLLEEHGIPTAFVKQTSETSFLATHCEMLPFECVARRIPYGSYLKRHPGIQPPTADTIAGIGGGGASGRWKEPMVEFFHKHAIIIDKGKPNEIDGAPTTSSHLISEVEAREKYMKDGEWTREVYTDPLISFNQHNDKWRLHPAKKSFSLMFYLMEIDPLETMKVMTDIKYKLLLPCFQALEDAFAKFDITLVDLKVEVGYREVDSDAAPETFKGYDIVAAAKKELVIADVIDNDSWRIWPGGDPTKQLDKQSFREGEESSAVVSKYQTVTHYTKQFSETT